MDQTQSIDAGAVAGLSMLGVMLTMAVYFELRDGRIPNWLCLAGMAAGLLIGGLPGGITLRSSLVGLLIGFGFLFVFYMFGGVGGGDVKLMGATGALLGSDLIQPALFFMAVIGAIMALIALVWSGKVRAGLEGVAYRLYLRKERGAMPAASQSPPVTVPYGVAIAAGSLAALCLRGI
ncbi:MAG: prepilin peptidase [bacterium]